MTRILVTGGAGFIGSVLAEKLISNKENYVVIPGEFDHFRVPGSMRESLLSSNLPKSNRWKNLKPRIPLIIRSLVSDKIFDNSL